MSRFNIEDAAFAGVGLLVRKPLAVFSWALVWALFLVLVTAPFIGPAASLVSLMVKTQGHADPESVLPLVGGLAAWGVLLWVGSLTVGALVQSAVIRAVLEPDTTGWTYLRLGRQETFVLSVNFVKSLILVGIAILIFAATGIVETMVAGAGRGPVRVVRLAGEFVRLVLTVWIILRFSVAAPMSFTDRQFRFFEAWTLTRGCGWPLLAVAIIAAVMVLAIYLVAGCVAVVGSMLLLNGAPRPTDLQNLLSLPPAQWEPVFAPYVIIAGVVSLLGGALITPIALAPWPHIYRTLAAQAEPETETDPVLS